VTTYGSTQHRELPIASLVPSCDICDPVMQIQTATRIGQFAGANTDLGHPGDTLGAWLLAGVAFVGFFGLVNAVCDRPTPATV
jgi:hypothetical protein